MSEKSGATAASDKTELEAIAWFTRMQGNPSNADQSDFRIWLDADATNSKVYNEISALWTSAQQTDLQIAAQDAAILEQRLAVVRRRRHFTKTAGVIASTLAIMVVGSWLWLEKPHFLQDMQADYVTARGEQRTLLLADGSTILMDADSALNVAIGAGERRVKILRGMAYFSVKPSTVPFIVAAAQGEAKVLGTAFDVSVSEQDVRVTLEHGRVQVTAENDQAAVILSPGEEVSYSIEGMGSLRKVDLTETMAWHEKRYVFTNARFADVIDYIARYHDGRIVVIGSQLADQRISGSFSLENTDAALASVQSIIGFKINKLSERVLIIR